jgi:hypothetical protein
MCALGAMHEITLLASCTTVATSDGRCHAAIAPKDVNASDKPAVEFRGGRSKLGIELFHELGKTF